MKRTSRESAGHQKQIGARMSKFAWLVLAIPTLAFVAVFQNCSKVEFQTAYPEKTSVPGEKESQFAELTAGDAKAFPPLKLLFVVDNSGTMAVNQINLASAFGKMFEGTNATNLAPFDSTALVINTAQRSIASTDALFSRVPNQGPATLSMSSLADLRALRGGSISEGKLAGDLAGYAAESVTVDGLKTVSYLPAPVLGLDGTVAEVGVRKLSGAPVTEFSKAFSDRIRILDPERSAIDPSTRAGVLDAIVDQESGLCSVARVLKNNAGLVNKGDLAAFVIVSDENDSDPAGRNCIDKYVDYRGTEDLIDGKCEQPRTTLSYFKAVANPDGAKCKVDYNTGVNFKYDYNYAQTKVSYVKPKYKYDQARTSVTYKVASYTQDVEKTDVSYYTKNPSYKVPQTNVTYATKVETCDMRDGLKVNCKITYPTASKIVDGSLNASTCAAIAQGKLPAGALTNDPARPLVCVATNARVVVGACTTELECNQNYSAALKTSLAGKTTSAACGTFVAGKLPAGAVYADAGKTPTCVDASSTSAKTAGRCPTGAKNCVETLSADTTKDFDGIASGSTCEAFAKTALMTVTGVVYGSAVSTDNPRCGAAIAVSRETESACPSPLPADRANCQMINGTVKKETILAGIQTPEQTCEAFIGTKITDRSKNSNDVPVCVNATETRSLSGTQSYAKETLVNYAPMNGDLCSGELKGLIKAKNSLPDASVCKVTGIAGSSETVSNKTCAVAQVAEICSNSNGTKRACAGSDIAPGVKFETTVTNSTIDEVVTCNMNCADTKLCKDKAGTVADNFNSCKTAIASASVAKTFTKELLANKANLCAAGQNVVQTKGPYREQGTVVKYVAGEASEKNEPNALANYIKSRSTELFGSTAPAVSVFVRQPGEATGQNGSTGTAYNSLASLMDGQKRSVTSGADSYATSLQSLSGVIRSKLDRAFSIAGFHEDQKVLKTWHRAAGTQEWIEASEGADWSASGGTVTLSANFDFKFGDQFRFEYK